MKATNTANSADSLPRARGDRCDQRDAAPDSISCFPVTSSTFHSVPEARPLIQDKPVSNRNADLASTPANSTDTLDTRRGHTAGREGTCHKGIPGLVAPASAWEVLLAVVGHAAAATSPPLRPAEADEAPRFRAAPTHQRPEPQSEPAAVWVALAILGPFPAEVEWAAPPLAAAQAAAPQQPATRAGRQRYCPDIPSPPERE